MDPMQTDFVSLRLTNFDNNDLFGDLIITIEYKGFTIKHQLHIPTNGLQLFLEEVANKQTNTYIGDMYNSLSFDMSVKQLQIKIYNSHIWLPKNLTDTILSLLKTVLNDWLSQNTNNDNYVLFI